MLDLFVGIRRVWLKNSQVKILEVRPHMYVKLSFREICDSVHLDTAITFG